MIISRLLQNSGLKIHPGRVDIDSNLEEWITEFKRCAYYAFMMTGVTGWEDFKRVARYGVY